MPQKALDAVQVRAVGEHSCRSRVSQEMRVENLEEFTNRVGSGWSALGAQLIQGGTEVRRQG